MMAMPRAPSATFAFNSRFSNWSHNAESVVFKAFKRDRTFAKEIGVVEDEEESIPWEDDPQNPVNWRRRRKINNSIVPLLLAFTCTLAATTITPSLQKVINDLGGQKPWRALPYAIYLLGMSIGMLLGTASIETSRRLASLFGYIPAFALAMLGSGLSRHLTVVIICRLLAGVFAAASSMVGLGMLLDMWQANRRATPVVVFFSIMLVAPSFGPTLGGSIAKAASWNWAELLFAFASAPLFISLYFMSETSLIGTNKFLPKASFGSRIKLFMASMFTRPFVVIVRHPKIMFSALACGFPLGIQFSLYTTLHDLLGKVHDIGPIKAYYTFFSLALGAIIAATIYILQTETTVAHLMRQWRKRQRSAEDYEEGHLVVPASHRLIPALPATILLPISLVFFAFTNVNTNTIFIPLAFLLFFAVAYFSIFISSFLFLLDALPPAEQNIGVAAFLFVSFIICAGLPLVFQHAVAQLDVKIVFSIMAGISGLFSASMWGMWLRARRVRP